MDRVGRGVAVALLSAVWFPVGAQTVPPGINRGVADRADAILRRADRNRDRVLDADELAQAREAARQQHGDRGVRALNQCIEAADADADGTLTPSEWDAFLQAVEARDGIRRETVRLPMSDGVLLATEVLRPAAPGRYPVILSRTPYGRTAGKHLPPLVLEGYAVVSQDMRGRFDSQGENIPFIGCGWSGPPDGVETVQWILRQEWCNGRIGTLGGSAGGITQSLLAATVPPGLLTCQYISVAAASLYHHAAYVGGALRLCQVDGWLRGNAFSSEAMRLYREHHLYDGFWEGYDATTRHASVTLPAVHVGGWFDTFCLGTVASFVGRQSQGGPGANGTQKLVLGPWAHGGFKDGGQVGELLFANARLPAAYSAAAWFRHHLCGEDNGADRLQPVAYYVMGDVEDADAPGKEWRFADAWPLPSRDHVLHLRGDGSLAADPAPADAGEATITYVFDPADPCPTVGGGNLNLPSGPMDQRQVEARPDVLNFTSDPLAEPLEVTGRIAAIIHLSSDAVDTDLSIRFCDVYPDGRSFLMAEGMQRLRLREGLSREVLLEPGAVVAVEVLLWPTSVAVNRDHRLRVTVTSSNHPRFDVNPGTGRPMAPGEPLRKQRNTLHCSPSHPSRVILPVPVDKPGR